MCDIGKRNRSEKQRKGCGDPRWCVLKICGITTVSYFLESTDKDESRLNSGRQRIGKKHDSQNAWSSPRLNIEVVRHSRSRLRNTRTRSVQSMSHDSPLCLQKFTTDLFPISSSYLTFYFSSKVDSLSLHTATQTLHSDTQSDHYPQSQLPRTTASMPPKQPAEPVVLDPTASMLCLILANQTDLKLDNAVLAPLLGIKDGKNV